MLSAMSLPEQGLAVIDPSCILQTDRMAVAAHCQRISFQLLDADRRHAIIGQLRARVESGELRRGGEHVPRGRRAPAGVGRGAFAAFSRGERPETRSCSHGATRDSSAPASMPSRIPVTLTGTQGRLTLPSLRYSYRSGWCHPMSYLH